MSLRYGNGSDGIVTISTNTTLTEDKQYFNLTVNNGITLNTAGYLVKVKDTLTNNGTVTNSSGNIGGAGGAKGATKTTEGPGNTGSNGGAGTGTGGSGGGGGGSGAAQFYTDYGTAQGGAGGTGGVGGQGGGTVLLNAKLFTNNGIIESNGSNGADGYYAYTGLRLWIADPSADWAGGGGGGGGGGNGGNGGDITLYYQSRTVGTVTVTGGICGSGGAAGAGEDCIYALPGGSEYSGGAGGSAGGGAGGKGEEGSDASDAGINGLAGTNGSAGSVTWNQEDAPKSKAVFLGCAF